MKAELEESGKGTLELLVTMVPQLFFDLIARILPGVVSIGSVLSILYGFEVIEDHVLKFKDASILNIALATFFAFCLFYVVSVALFGIWSLLVRFPVYLILRFLCYIATESGLAKKWQKLTKPKDEVYFDDEYHCRFSEVFDSGREFATKYDRIKLERPSVGSRITKLYAEKHMSGSLVVAFLLCSYLGTLEPVSPAIVWGFFVAAIGMFFSNIHFDSRLSRSIESHDRLIPKKPSA